MDDEIGEWGVQNGRGIEFLSSDGRADDGENSRSDDGADAQRSQRPRAERLFQPMFGFLRLGDQLIDGLAREDLFRQDDAPRNTEIDASGLKQKAPARSK